MRLGILSDSHDHLPHLRKGIELLKKRRVEGWIHLGDYVAPFAARLLQDLEGPRYFLWGNNDGEKTGLLKTLPELAPGPLTVEIQNRRLFLMHEPYALEAAIKSGAYDLILYGHTHTVDYRRVGGTVILNPGEVCGYLSGIPSVALVDLEPLRVEVLTVFGDPVELKPA